MKTAEELGISAEEMNALLQVREMLASGKIAYRGEDDLFLKPKDKPLGIFNMTFPCEQFSCGTVGCIGGWMKILMLDMKPHGGVYSVSGMTEDKIDLYVYGARDTRPIGSLFFPPKKFDYYAVTSVEAVRAIDNFLTAGDPGWDDILTVLLSEYGPDDD